LSRRKFSAIPVVKTMKKRQEILTVLIVVLCILIYRYNYCIELKYTEKKINEALGVRTH
jgi:hypothetical protein